MDNRPLGLFESGVGGLSIWRAIRRLLPQESMLFLADSGNVPYGEKTTEQIRDLATRITRFLLAHDAKMIVVACNTAFTLAGTDLRAAFPHMKFVGTVPAIKPAAERTRSGLVSVLATPGTVKRAYTRDLIQSFASQCHVRLVGSVNLASMAEAYIRGEGVDDEALTAEIRDCFYEKDDARTDIVVLACTHYPFLANVFRRLAPRPVDWIDPAEAIARQARRIVPVMDVLRADSRPDRVVFTSDSPDFATRRLMQGFGLSLLV